MSSSQSVFPHQPFQGIATFGHQPIWNPNESADAVILGIPFDGTVSGRSGTRLGPRAIREQSMQLWGYNNALRVAPFEVLRVVDGGDVEVIPPSVETTHRHIEQAASGIIQSGACLISLGGEHSVTLPLLRAHAAKYGPLALVHIDAHPDTWDEEYDGMKFSHGTPFRRAAEEGLLDPAAFIQIGIRGPTGGPSCYADARRFSSRFLTMDDVVEAGIAATVADVRACVGARPAYVTLDIDAADPAFAPGTGTPEVGGFTSRELLTLVRGLRDLNLVGFDLVEVSPPFDPSGITALLGANLVFEFLSLQAAKKLKALR